MLERLKNIHPGWFIAAFFFVLIVFNVIFFVIAASEPVDLVPAAPKAAPAEVGAPPPGVLQPGAAAGGADAGPTEPR